MAPQHDPAIARIAAAQERERRPEAGQPLADAITSGHGAGSFMVPWGADASPLPFPLPGRGIGPPDGFTSDLLNTGGQPAAPRRCVRTRGDFRPDYPGG